MPLPTAARRALGIWHCCMLLPTVVLLCGRRQPALWMRRARGSCRRPWSERQPAAPCLSLRTACPPCRAATRWFGIAVVLALPRLMRLEELHPEQRCAGSIVMPRLTTLQGLLRCLTCCTRAGAGGVRWGDRRAGRSFGAAECRYVAHIFEIATLISHTLQHSSGTWTPRAACVSSAQPRV